MQIDFQKQVDKVLREKLSEREHAVIIARFGLGEGKPQTLQRIAHSHGLTRERIRQIQEQSIRKLMADDCTRALSSVTARLERVFAACGTVATESKICDMYRIRTSQERGCLNLLLTVHEKFRKSRENEITRQYWYTDPALKKEVEKMLERIHRNFEDEKGMTKSDAEMEMMLRSFLSAQRKENAHDIFSDGSLIHLLHLSKLMKANDEGHWGHRRNPEISLRNVNGYIKRVLRNADGPLHFREIAEEITKLRNSPCNVHSCHNELVRNEKFVLVGRGMYALSDTHRHGTITEIIQQILDEHGSLSKETIVRKVLEERQVRESSIVQNLLNKKKFSREKDGRYIRVS